MKRIPVAERSDLEGLIEFSQKYPWRPQYPSSLARRFLTELISDRNLIFDLHDQRGRVSSAVLLDKVSNPANDACLEILSMRPDADSSAVLAQFIALAKRNLPKGKSGAQVGWSEVTALSDEFLSDHGLKKHYDTYEMRAELGHSQPSVLSEIVAATIEDRDKIYELLCISLADNPEASVPDARSWKSNFLKSPGSYFFIWKSGGEFNGFANLATEGDGEAEVRTIGVLPQARGSGVGSKLLNHCLHKAKSLGAMHCYLTVAVANQTALGIYLRAGFETIEKFRCYRFIS